MAIGVIGIGNMGLAMALRLRDTGHDVVVRDLLPSREALAREAGARSAATPCELAGGCSLVIVAVVDAAQVMSVLCGEDDVLRATPRPQTVMLCPTIGPSDVERAARLLAGAGIGVIDAPMSGGPARARDGSMSLLVACDDAHFVRHETVLRTLASRLVRVGTRVGDGARAKLVNNLLAAINLAGAAEALALAQRVGLDPALALEVIEQSSGQSWIGSDRMRRALTGDFTPRAHTGLLAKDSTLALAMAAEAGQESPVGHAAAAWFTRACAAGEAGLDDACLFRFVYREAAARAPAPPVRREPANPGSPAESAP